jgi:hypothetical protein
MLFLVDQDDYGEPLPEIPRDDLPSLRLPMNQVGEWLAAAFPDSHHDGVLISSFEHGAETRNPRSTVRFSNGNVDAKTTQGVNEGVLTAVAFERVLPVILLSHDSISDVIKRKSPTDTLRRA